MASALRLPLNAPATASVVVENAPVLDGVMRPSEFPGVETVSIPDPPKNSAVKVGSALDKKSQAAKKVVGKTADGKAWVRVLPGDKTPDRRLRGARSDDVAPRKRQDAVGRHRFDSRSELSAARSRATR